MKKKNNTHTVIKNEDIEKYLDEEHKRQLDWILNEISIAREADNKKPSNSYYICNTDEPYAEKVLNIILKNEDIYNDINKVSVRWWDGYLEEFEATEVRFGCDLLWMRLSNGTNRHIPLRQVRWFAMDKERHQSLK